MEYVIGICVVLAVLAALWIILTLTWLLRGRKRVDAAWGQLEVQLLHRHDLTPNLVETVRGYASHERATLERVTRARTAAVEARRPEQRAEAEAGLSIALRGLLAVAEAYPDLQARTSFVSLQDELARTEDKAADARQRYNDAVLGFNNAVQSFPSMIVAGLAEFRPRKYFRAGDDERAVPQVRL